MSQQPAPTYRISHPQVPDSDSDNQDTPSPQATSSSSPSSIEFSSDPSSTVNPTLTITQPTPNFALPSTASEFNLNQPTTQPNSLLPNPPPIPQPTRRHTMANPTQVGVNALPIQGKRDAPRTFKGSYDKIEEFLKTMDKLFARYQVTADQEKVEAIFPYCSTKVQDFIHLTVIYYPRLEGSEDTYDGVL